MNKPIQYRDQPLNPIQVVPDFLSSPDKLALKNEQTKVVISPNSGEGVVEYQPLSVVDGVDLRQLRPLLEGRHSLQLAIVFGSLARGAAGTNSDLDIAVQADRPLSAARGAELIELLAAACGRPVDLIDLTTVGEPLLGEILTHGRRLFGSDAAHAALIRRHVFDTEDFLPYVQRMLRERRRAWIG